MVFPSTACILQNKLGANGGAAFDVQAVCSGFVYALTVADAMIQTGAATRALVGAAHWREIQGTHLFPFEQPQATAQAVLELLAALTRLPGPGR